MGAPPDRHRPGLKLHDLIDAGKHNEAGALLDDLLTRDPDDPEALFYLCRLFIETNRPAFAHPIAGYLTTIAPDRPASWAALGHTDAAMQRAEQAVKHLTHALKLKPGWIEPLRALCNAYVMLHRFDDAKRVALEALKNDDHHLPHVALAFAHLHKREWKEGWKHYTRQMGKCRDRPLHDYGLKEWRGDGTVLIYGEQGLGDQLAYMSATDERCVQVSCHPKLANLLRRSLKAEVHGDQFVSEIAWTPKAEHQASMATAMQWQEVKRRGRYLTPHPEKAIQWRGLMHAAAKIKDRAWIGLAWTGGATNSHGGLQRNLTPDQLRPILDLPCNFVSLEYRPHDPVPGVHCWPWATQTADLDDAAALVANLNAVVCVPTTAYHLAGGLGIPCHVIVHDTPHFHEGMEGDSPWWESVKFHRRTQGLDKAIATVAELLWRKI